MSDPNFGGMDFAVGSVKGYRGFDLERQTGRLMGATAPYVWRNGENTAICRARRHEEHCIANTLRVSLLRVCSCGGTGKYGCGDLIDPNCGCGFWAYYAGQHTTYGGTVFGVIEGYGRTTLGTRGFRSEKARIVALTLPHAKEPEPRPAPEKTGDPIVDAMNEVVASLSINSVSVSAAFAALTGDPIPLRAKVRERITRRYPRAEIFETREAMLAAHPIEEAPESEWPTDWYAAPGLVLSPQQTARLRKALNAHIPSTGGTS